MPKYDKASSIATRVHEVVQTGRDKRISIAIFCLLAFSYLYVHQRIINSPTALSRLDLLHALYVHHTLVIDAYETNTMDKAFFDNHYYSDKAPGTVVLALPFFLASAWSLTRSGTPVDSDIGWLSTSWISCAFALGLLSALGGVASFNWLKCYVSERSAFITTIAIFIGSLPMPYTTMMYSHAQTVALLMIAMWALDQPFKFGSDTWGHQNKMLLTAGMASGLALASEYTAGLIVLAILLWVLRRRRRKAILFCAAAVPGLLLVPLYSWLTLGNPLTLPYSYQASFPAMKEGLFAIKWPDFQTGFRLLFGASRGLFFWSPFLLMALPGYWHLFIRSRNLFYVMYVGFLIQVAVISGRTWDWQAGPSFGPRYLAPALIFLALPCALATDRLGKTGLFLAYVSTVLTSIATLTRANIPMGENNPFWDLNLRMLLSGDLNPNLGTVLGLSPILSVVIFYAVIIVLSWCIISKLNLKSLSVIIPPEEVCN